MKNTFIIMEQYKVFLKSVPNEPTFGEELIDVPVLISVKSNFPKYKNDESWKTISTNVNHVISSIEKVFDQLNKCKFQVPATDKSVNTFDKLPIVKLSVILKELDYILANIAILKETFGDMPLGGCLTWISQEIQTLSKKLRKENEEDELDSKGLNDKVKITTDKLSKAILVSIQSIYKKYQNNDVVASNEEENIELIENHLKSHIVDNIDDDLEKLELKNVFKYSKNLSRCPEIFSAANKSYISTCLPLMEQINLLYEYFVTQQVSAYRTTSKLNSILLNLFIDLASKVCNC